MKSDPRSNNPKSNIEWVHWGEVDPLYGVCSVLGKSRSNADPWTEEDFYARAVPEFETNLRHWEQYGLKRESCVEIGCGAGRMTRCLQGVFSAVHALDVSPGMLARVQRVCDPAIVRTYIGNGTILPLPDSSITAAYSTIVFQHFDSPEVGLAYFREIHRVLRPDGTIMINLPWHQFPNTGLQWPYRLAYGVSRLYDAVICGFKRALLKLGPSVTQTRIGRRLSELMGATSYDFKLLTAEMARLGFDDIEVRCYYIPIEERHQPFVFARKRSHGTSTLVSPAGEDSRH